MPPSAPSLPVGSRVLVVGAGGHLGRHVVRAFRARGHRVRALTRRASGQAAAPATLGADEIAVGDLLRPDTLGAARAGAEVVFSCAGASLDMRAIGDRRTFAEADERGNLALLDAAQRAGVARFGYVSLAGGASLVHTEYARAHEAVVAALARSRVPHTVVRPTALFWFLDEMVRMARGGRGAAIGDGTARTNPIHEADAADACVDAITDGVAELSVGGPEVLTREEIVRLAFAAVGRPPRIAHLPPAVARGMTAVVRPLHARLAAVLEFGAAVSVVDAVAPARGTRTLAAHFRDVAARGAA